MTEKEGSLGSSTRGASPGALEVLAGIGKFVTTNSTSGIGLLARPDLPDGIAVDKRVLSIPARPGYPANLYRVHDCHRYIVAAVANTQDSDDTIVSYAKRILSGAVS